MNLNINKIVTQNYKKYLRLLIQKAELDIDENLKIIADTRSQGDLKENSAYHEARNQHRDLENKLLEYSENMSLTEYNVVNKDYIDFGALFTIIDINKNTCKYLLLDDIEAEYEKNIISRQSPIGQIFLFKKVNEVIEFPNEDLNYSIKINKNRIEKIIGSHNTTELTIISIEYLDLNYLYDDKIKDLKSIVYNNNI